MESQEQMYWFLVITQVVIETGFVTCLWQCKTQKRYFDGITCLVVMSLQTLHFVLSIYHQDESLDYPDYMQLIWSRQQLMWTDTLAIISCLWIIIDLFPLSPMEIAQRSARQCISNISIRIIVAAITGSFVAWVYVQDIRDLAAPYGVIVSCTIMGLVLVLVSIVHTTIPPSRYRRQTTVAIIYQVVYVTLLFVTFYSIVNSDESRLDPQGSWIINQIAWLFVSILLWCMYAASRSMSFRTTFCAWNSSDVSEILENEMTPLPPLPLPQMNGDENGANVHSAVIKSLSTIPEHTQKSMGGPVPLHRLVSKWTSIFHSSVLERSTRCYPHWVNDKAYEPWSRHCPKSWVNDVTQAECLLFLEEQVYCSTIKRGYGGVIPPKLSSITMQELSNRPNTIKKFLQLYQRLQKWVCYDEKDERADVVLLPNNPEFLGDLTREELLILDSATRSYMAFRFADSYLFDDDHSFTLGNK